ncbi:MAG: hypothetical protein L3J35_09360 [Bacteroidales bacterium]|nr:hypothetical protein [Bacteroidales bacterium]
MKRILFFIIIITVYTIKLIGQNNVNVKASVGINNVIINPYLLDETVREPIPVLSSSIGFMYEIKKNKSYNVGVLFSYKPTKINLEFEDSLKVFEEDTTYYVNNFTDQNRNFYISIPVSINFLEKQKIGFSTGLSNNFLISKMRIYDTYRFYNLSLLVGINYKLNEKCKLSLDFNTDILSYIKHSYHSEYNYGAMVSLKYKLF